MRQLDGVIAATPHIAERFSEINPRTININNYPLPDELAPIDDASHRRKRQVCYVGGITRARGVVPLIRALPMVPHLTLVLCGRFLEPDLECSLRELPGWRQVRYLGQVDREGVKRVLSESVAGIVTLLPTPAYVVSLPIKLFEYMSAELPVIASDFALWRGIVGESGAGFCVDPLAPEAIADAIKRVLDDPELARRMGRAGRRVVLERYNWLAEAEKLAGFYRGIR